MKKANYKLKLGILLIALIALSSHFIPSTYSKYTNKETKHVTINAIQPTYTVVFEANGGTGSMSSQQFTYKTAQNLRTNAFTRTGFVFEEWTTNSDGTGDHYTDQESVNNLTKVNNGVIHLYAQWTECIARIGSTYYISLEDAVAVANASSSQTTIVLLKNTTEKIQINSGKNVILDLNGKTISWGNGVDVQNTYNDNTIKNYGTLELRNGTVINRAATNGAINNYTGANITLDNVTVEVQSGGNRQALYNERGTATLTGGSVLRSVATGRCAVTNRYSNSTMYVIDATIESTGNCGLNNEGTLVIGTQGGTPSKTNPTIRGNDYGITSDVAYSFYDGIIEGVTDSVSDKTQITNYESGYDFIEIDKTISNKTYHALYLGHKITITFDPNQGIVDVPSKDIELGGEIGSLPTPTRTGFIFVGWFTEASGGTIVTETTTFNSSTTIFARWTTSYTLSFDTMGGNTIPALTNQPENTIVDLSQYIPTRSGYDFEGWYDDNIYSNKITSVTLTSDTTVFANWTLQPFEARINSTDYTTLADAWTVAMASNTTTTIVILKDCITTSALSVSSSKSVIVDLNSHSIDNANGTIFEIKNGGTFELTDTGSGGTISGGIVNSSSKQVPVIVNKSGGSTTISGGTVRSDKSQVIDNSGTMNITGGTVTFFASVSQGLINNNAGATLNISGGAINNPYAVQKGQAVYNLGTLNISGNAVLISNSKERATVQNDKTGAIMNISGGTISSTYNNCNKGAVENSANNTVTITGGTITSVSTNSNGGAVNNAGTLTIGVKDGNISTTSPVLMGKVNGVKNTGTFNFYDGIIEGETNAIVGIANDIETNSQIVNGTDGNYITAYLDTVGIQPSNPHVPGKTTESRFGPLSGMGFNAVDNKEQDDDLKEIEETLVNDNKKIEEEQTIETENDTEEVTTEDTDKSEDVTIEPEETLPLKTEEEQTIETENKDESDDVGEKKITPIIIADKPKEEISSPLENESISNEDDNQDETTCKFEEVDEANICEIVVE